MLSKLAVLGRPGGILAVLCALLFLAVLPFSARQIYWLLESDRIVEETADPIVMEVSGMTGEGGKPVPQRTWIAGDTFWVQRELCIYRAARGTVERVLIDSATLNLPDLPLNSLLYLDGSSYDEQGHLRPPPWCVTRLFPVSTPSFLAPGAITLRTRLDVDLNPLKPHVIVSLRPVNLTIIASPLRQAVEANREMFERELRVQQRKTARLSEDVALLHERVRDEAMRLALVEGYVARLDAYLRSIKILPPPPAVPRKP